MAYDLEKTTRQPFGKRGQRQTPKGHPTKWEQRKTRFRPEHPVPEFVDWLATKMAADTCTAKTICRTHKGAPSYETLMSWLSRDVELEQKYLAAQRIAVHARIEKLCDEADALLALGKEGKLHKDQVAAYTAFARTIQWVAARWHKDVYGDQQQRSTIVPVQIVTNLDFGQEGVVKDNPQDVYTIDAEIERGPEESEQPEQD